MSAAEDYILLALRLGKHVDGLVDAYYGPQDLRDAVDDEPPVHAADLVEDATALRDSLDDGWLRDQVNGCLTAARVLAGEQLTYTEEVEGSHGVRPERTPEEQFEEVHAELDELLPGDGSLAERRLAWRERHLCPGDRAVPVLEELLPLLRAATARIVDLPDGERVTLEPVSDEPWWAFNYYQGDLHSRVVVNIDVPTTGIDLLHLAAHEVYPGHHTEHALKEHLLVRGEGRLEETIAPVPTPSSVVSEGIAEAGGDVAIDEATREQVYAILRGHDIELPDPERAARVSAAIDRLRGVGINAALFIHEDGMSLDDAQEYVRRWTLNTPEQAAQSIRFLTDPTWRAYSITYSAGRRLCAGYIDGDPAKLRRLLTEHVRVGELSSR